MPGRTLIAEASVWLERGEHVCLVGANGSGKTTLVETLTGERELERGKLRRGHNVKLGYLSQHTDLAGPPGTTVLAHAQARDRPQRGEDAGAARPLPLLRRGRAEDRRRPLGR